VKCHSPEIRSFHIAAAALQFRGKPALTVAGIPAHYSIGLKLPLPPIV
jgi:hypothetical protein